MNIELLLEKYLACSGVSIDTRTIAMGDLFVALQGPNFDGNTYVEVALEKGATHVLCSDPTYAENENVTVVEDSLEVLQQLATAYRLTWDCPVVGLTGSNGKTTTKELLAAMLATTYRVYATAGNLNNHIGVPLSLLRAPGNAEIVVIEMGANHVGEIADLCQIAKPTHGFITNVGRAHLEGFGGLDGVRQGKGELFDFLKPKGQAFINVGDRETMDLGERAGTCLFFAGTEADRTSTDKHLIFSAEMEECFPVVKGDLAVNGTKEGFVSHLPGQYNYQNILVASAVASYFKVSFKRIATALSTYVPSNARSEIKQIGDSKVLFDAYNANPDSVAAALSWISSRPEARKVIVLGELAELGAFAKTEHEQAAEKAVGISGSEVAFFGAAYEGLIGDRAVFTDLVELKIWLSHFLGSPDTVILLKGSRSNRLERLL
ncbi:MAG: UDP-N-acetylmuramoyl-tripeptide--D-alanyl-D-alanine ligase [Saprospiraceae bacterium]